MRIISGTHKSRNIIAPKTLPVRPTTDFAKESIFNIINNHFEFEQLSVLDLFSGTGNIAYEFASRGSQNITAVDVDTNCSAFIKKMAQTLNFQNIITIKSDVFGYLKYCKNTFDIIFADPPYTLNSVELIPNLIFEKQLLKHNGWLILEHDAKKDFKNHNCFIDQRHYGKVNFSIFKTHAN